jgi:hypothetical protein
MPILQQRRAGEKLFIALAEHTLGRSPLPLIPPAVRAHVGS